MKLVLRVKVILSAIVMAVTISGPALAADDLQEKVLLQQAMTNFLDDRSTDGQIILLDQNDNALKSVYLAGAHPMIVPLKDGSYFLCADGYDAAGNKVDLDFLVQPATTGFRVIDAMLNARASVKTIVESQ